MFRENLCWARLCADSAKTLLELLAGQLEAQGLVHPSFAQAVWERELQAPTGLPLAGRKVALPHADPHHVKEPAVAVATLERPVVFFEMGNPEQELPVEVVVMLALPTAETAQQTLFTLIERLQDPAYVDRIWAAPDRGALYKLLVAPAEAAGKGEP